MNNGKTHYSVLRTNWKHSIKLFGLIIVVLVWFVGCSSSKAIQYQDRQSDSVMLKKIEQQYYTWRKTPYRYGGNSLKGTDCSGLVMNFYYKKMNISLPRVTTQQAKMGKEVSQLKAGDLVFFKTGKGKTGLHVGIYYKNGTFLHISTSKGVQYSSLKQGYWKDNYWMARRIVN